MDPTQKPLPDNTQHNRQTSMSPAGFETAIPTSERRKTHALDCASTDIDNKNTDTYKFRQEEASFTFYQYLYVRKSTITNTATMQKLTYVNSVNSNLLYVSSV